MPYALCNMPSPSMPTYRKMTLGDLLALDQIDPNFTSTSYLDVERVEQAGVLQFTFTERPFETPFTKELGAEQKCAGDGGGT
jgi:hypothetical protein